MTDRKLKVPVGVTSYAGYSVTAAALVAAVVAYAQGDRSDQTLGVLTAGAIAALSFVVTQLGRYAQSHALAKAPATQVVYAGGSVATTPRTAPTSDAEPPPLTDAEADVDPDMGDPLDAGPESYLGDPDDRHGADDQPVP